MDMGFHIGMISWPLVQILAYDPCPLSVPSTWTVTHVIGGGASGGCSLVFGMKFIYNLALVYDGGVQNGGPTVQGTLRKGT